MDKRQKKLREYFKDAGPNTRLAIVGPSWRLVINGEPLELIEYSVGDNQTMYAAYSRELDKIFVRLIDESFFEALS